MNASEMPTTQDAVIVEALGQPLAVLYAGAAAGLAEPVVQQVLELRSFLAVIEDQAGKARERIHQAAAPGGDVYGLSGQDLRFQISLLEAAQAGGRRYEQMLRELLPTALTNAPSPRRPVQSTRSEFASVAMADGALTARPRAAEEPSVEVGAGRHRR